MNEECITCQVWVNPLGIALTAVSITFIPVMFFCNHKYSWVGRVGRTRQPDVNASAPSEDAPDRSTKFLLSSNESNDPYIQSDSSIGVGVSILLNPLSAMTSLERHSDKRERKSVTITDAHVEYHPAEEEDKLEALVIIPTPQTACQRHLSESSIDNTTK